MNRDEILQAAAHGNVAALEFLRSLAARAHWIDDLRDRDKVDKGGWYEADGFAIAEAEWLLMLSSNPFFLTHRAALVPVLLLALNAWADSEGIEWDSSDVRDVIKGQWHEVVWLVAWLTGGWAHLRDTTSRYRSYDLEPENQEAGCRRNGAPTKGDNGTVRQ